MIVGLCFVACFRLDDHLAMHFCGLGCFLAGLLVDTVWHVILSQAQAPSSGALPVFSLSNPTGEALRFLKTSYFESI